jgi:hypothetical protein
LRVKLTCIPLPTTGRGHFNNKKEKKIPSGLRVIQDEEREAARKLQGIDKRNGSLLQ